MGDWCCFVFQLKLSGKYYLINDGSEEKAWKTLSQLLSRSLERTKLDCQYVTFMTYNDMVKVLK